MSSLTVIYDPNVEVAVIVDLDNFTALPMAGPGAASAGTLQAFIDQTPFDLAELNADAQLAAFMSFLDRNAAPEPVASDTLVDVPAGDVGGDGVGDGAALAEREAANAADVPPPQPADADGGAVPDTTPTEIDCPNCNGEGVISYGEGAAPEQCRMCRGTRKVTIQVPA